MALSMQKTFNGLTYSAYVRVDMLRQSKNKSTGGMDVLAIVGYYATGNEEHAISTDTFHFESANDGINTPGTYTYLKTLPDFAGAEDC